MALVFFSFGWIGRGFEWISQRMESLSKYTNLISMSEGKFYPDCSTKIRASEQFFSRRAAHELCVDDAQISRNNIKSVTRRDVFVSDPLSHAEARRWLGSQGPCG